MVYMRISSDVLLHLPNAHNQNLKELTLYPFAKLGDQIGTFSKNHKYNLVGPVIP